MLHDLRYATRTLRRSPGFTLTVVLTLALGVGANTAMFSVIYTVMLRPLPYPDPGRLVMLWERDAQKGVEQGLVTPANFVDWRAQSRAFDAMGFSPAWSGSRWFNLAGKDGNERVRGAYVSSGFFAAMGVQPALGRGFVAAEDDPKSNPVAVVSHGLWQRRFGADPKVVSGQSVEVDSYNSRRYTIVGVMPPGFQFPEQAEIWLPAGYMGVKVPPPGSSDRCCPWLQVVARLKPGVTLDQARSEMSTIARRITAQYPGARFSSEVKVVPLHEQLVGPARQALLVLLGAVVFVLLIACANVANLLLARAAAHRPELEIRAALGAGRARLLLHLLADSLLLALLGGAAGLGVALAASRFVPAVNLNPTVLFFTLALSVATALFSGLLPALTATRPRVSVSPRPRVSTSRLLVVSEMALALMLLSGAGLLLRSFLKLQAVDPGFRPQ
ncbi:MAG: ABC transporter permease, partial [Acidobacteria bacterium]|nr:ABC transporter permease [Acidobacteriota bacterium]